MATFVLVGGAWIGGWAWQDVAKTLRAEGHAVYPVTLTGLGERIHLAQAEIDLVTHITDVINVIEYEGLSDVVLVGHSYAGIVVQGVADRLAERLSSLIYLDSGPLSEGMAMIDFYPPEAGAQFRQVVDQAGDGWRLPFPGLETLAQMASLAGLGNDQRRLLAEKATAQPFGTYLQPVQLANTFAGAYERHVILCTDGGFTSEQVRASIMAGEPFFQALAASDWRFHEIHTGHWPMLSTPETLATTLQRIWLSENVSV